MRKTGSGWARALLAALCIAPLPGGAAEPGSVLGKVVQLSAEHGRYTFQFEQRDGDPELMPGCRRLDIELHYTYRPDTWLPLMRGTYPSRHQTSVAVDFLKRALSEGREIYLGRVGDGLNPSGKPCAFASHALTLEYRGEHELVMSYYGK